MQAVEELSSTSGTLPACQALGVGEGNGVPASKGLAWGN